MMQNTWQELLLHPGSADLVWELFHENSKRGRYDEFPSDEEIAARLEQLHQSLPIVGAPIIQLPPPLPLNTRLDSVISSRRSCYTTTDAALTLNHISTLIGYSSGITMKQGSPTTSRPLRAAPSAGALYPLEIFFHSVKGPEMRAGFYYYNPFNSELRLIKEGDARVAISEAMIQQDIPFKTSLIVFITAVFDRSVFKYGDRAYRFILLEAGHVVQNLNLVSEALGLGCLNVGGYFDREIDHILGIDGLTHSTIYMVAIGKKPEA